MFDPKSDYALNKLDPEAIVYPSATGVHIRLTRADFASEDEFQRWKNLSDEDYGDMEKAGRDFYDNCVQMDDRVDASGAGPSVEDFLLSKQDDELVRLRTETTAASIAQIKAHLTKKQYRRLWLLLVKKLSVEEIAAQEGVTPRAVYACLAKARGIIVNKL